MDELDRNIVSMLINDGKTSNAAITRQAGVSESIGQIPASRSSNYSNFQAK